MSLFNSVKAYGASISLHILILSSFWFASAQITTLRKEEPITIDFTLGNGQEAAPAPLPAPATPPVKKKAPTPPPKPKVEETPPVPTETALAEPDTLDKDSVPETQEIAMESTDSAAVDSVPETMAQAPVSHTTAPGTAEGTGMGSGGKADKMTAYLQNQFLYIRKIIAANMVYPETARDKEIEGSLLLSFVIEKNGSVTQVKIVKSSGHSLLDEDAMATVYKSTPFPKPPFPAQLKVPITYKLL